MKKHLLICSCFCVFLIAIIGSCTKKGITDPVTLDKAAGTWSINSIRYNVSYGTATTIDSTVPWRPIIGNSITFDGVSKMNYSFNMPYSNYGTYKIDGTDSMTISFSTADNRIDGIDSIVKLLGTESGRWKILLLTSTNFNIEKTTTYNKAFPGANSIVTFQSFVR